jgi:signal transduction histidine kinase
MSPERRRRGEALAIIAILVFGALVTLLAAAATAMSTSDALGLAALAAAAAAAGALGGALTLRVARGRTITVQSSIAAVTALIAVVVGVLGSAQAMFFTEEDLGALVVILGASVTIAAAAAVVIGARVGRASAALVESARQLGDGAIDLGTPVDLPHELALLHAELSRSAARLADSRSRERALDRSRRELVAWVSHDLRTPLAGIRALAEALEDGVVEDPVTVSQYYTSLRVQADRLSELVDDLFELSRTQAGVLHLEFERVSLGDLVSDTLSCAAPLAEAKGVRLEGRLEGPAPEVVASSREVLRAMRNVLENAIRYTPSDGSVTIEAGAERGCAYVSVVDTGGGIADDELERVFDVAFRGDAARRPGEGAGLGLAIARGIIEAHHGDITVCNRNGGACFTMRLPLEQADPA